MFLFVLNHLHTLHTTIRNYIYIYLNIIFDFIWFSVWFYKHLSRMSRVWVIPMPHCPFVEFLVSIHGNPFSKESLKISDCHLFWWESKLKKNCLNGRLKTLENMSIFVEKPNHGMPWNLGTPNLETIVEVSRPISKNGPIKTSTDRSKESEVLSRRRRPPEARRYIVKLHRA